LSSTTLAQCRQKTHEKLTGEENKSKKAVLPALTGKTAVS